MDESLLHSNLYWIGLKVTFVMLWLTAAACTPVKADAISLPAPDPQVGDSQLGPFYQWSKSLPSDRGKVLRTEALSADKRLEASDTAWRILYTSTEGLDGHTRIIVSGTVYLPRGPRPQHGWPVVAWSHGTTGVADKCAPSWRGWLSRDRNYLNSWLNNGYAIVATDYEGLGVSGPHPYLLPRPEAYSVLDSVTAALSAWPDDLQNKVFFVGQSQGSGAALAAAYYAPTYAPSIRALGVVATGIVGITVASKGTSIPAAMRERSIENPSHSPAAYEIMVLIGTWKAVTPSLNYQAYVSDKAHPLLDTALSGCLGDVFKLAATLNIQSGDVFKRDTIRLEQAAAPYESIPDAAITIPIFSGTGLADDEAQPRDQYKFLAAACSAHSTVQYHYYPGLTHNGALNASLKDSIPFTLALLAGKHTGSYCKTLEDPGPVQSPTPNIPGNN